MAEAAAVVGLSREFRSGDSRVQALVDVSLVVGEGELVAVLGRTGAGKTTLLSLIGGLDSPQPGTVRVGGRDVGLLAGRELDVYRQRSVGWVFQNAGLLPLLTATENVALTLRILGQSPQQAEPEARAALEAVGLADRAQHRALELSGGEQQRVALARALVKAPALLLADEPTAQLDTETARSVLALIRLAADSGIAVLLATHDQAVHEVADRVLLIEDGRVLAGGQ